MFSRLSVRYCLYTWPSQDGCKLRSSQLQNSAECSSRSVVRQLLPGTQSCGLEGEQTDDMFGPRMATNV